MGSTKDHNLGFTESFGQKNQASKSTWTILLYCHVFVVGLYLANVWATSSTTTPTIKAVRFEVQDLFTTFDLVQLRVRGLGDLTNLHRDVDEANLGSFLNRMPILAHIQQYNCSYSVGAHYMVI